MTEAAETFLPLPLPLSLHVHWLSFSVVLGPDYYLLAAPARTGAEAVGCLVALVVLQCCSSDQTPEILGHVGSTLNLKVPGHDAAG